MRKPKIFTQEVLDRIPVMVEDGMKLQEIADKIGCKVSKWTMVDGMGERSTMHSRIISKQRK